MVPSVSASIFGPRGRFLRGLADGSAEAEGERAAAAADAAEGRSPEELARRRRPRTEAGLMASALVRRAGAGERAAVSASATGSVGVRRFEMESGRADWPAAVGAVSGAERTVLEESWGVGGVDGSSEAWSGWEGESQVWSSVGSPRRAPRKETGRQADELAAGCCVASSCRRRGTKASAAPGQPIAGDADGAGVRSFVDG